jgi:hypothetical protein
MKALRDPARTKISIRWKIDTSPTFHREIKAKPLPIDFHPKKVKPLPPCIKVIRLLRSILVCLLSMKKTIEEIPLILFGNSNAKILNFEKRRPIFPF